MRRLTRLTIVIVTSIIVALTLSFYCNKYKPDSQIEETEVVTPSPTVTPNPLATPTPPLVLISTANDTPLPQTSDEALALAEIEQERLIIAGELLDRVNALGYENDEVSLFAEGEVAAHANNLNFYNMEYERLLQEEIDAFWAPKWEEYPTATYVWLFLTEELCYNDYVAAGIIGNMMTECGGQTLYLNSSVSSGSYYGLCQWGPYFPGAYGMSLEQQCCLLADTIAREMNDYSSCSGYNYNGFIQITDCRTAARAFAQSYERCTSSSYGQRQNNAEIAYYYFTNDT